MSTNEQEIEMIEPETMIEQLLALGKKLGLSDGEVQEITNRMHKDLLHHEIIYGMKEPEPRDHEATIEFIQRVVPALYQLKPAYVWVGGCEQAADGNHLDRVMMEFESPLTVRKAALLADLRADEVYLVDSHTVELWWD